MADTWITAEDGRVFVRRPFDFTAHWPGATKWELFAYKNPPDVDSSTGAYIDAMAFHATDVLPCVERWLPLIEQTCSPLRLPPAWLASFVYAESRGNEKAEAADGGWGLMQITAPGLKKGKTKEQVFDPANNLRIGAGVIAAHARVTQDLPALASCYNAGASAYGVPHTSTRTPWGYACAAKYISIVVAANNAMVRWLKDGVC